MRTILLAIFILSSISALPQTPLDKAVELVNQFVETKQHLYHDMEIINAGNAPVAVIGIDMSSASYYYTNYSYYYPVDCYTALRMTHFKIEKANYKFTRTFIYDEFQNLRYYMYTSNGDVEDTVLEYIVAYNSGESQIISQKNMNIADQNRFAYSEYMFEDSVIIAYSELQLNSLEEDGFTINYGKQTKFIRKEFARINNCPELTTNSNDSITAYYMNGSLVKVVVDGFRQREYYLSNNSLIFAFYKQQGTLKDQRIYYHSSIPYRYQLGNTLVNITIPDNFAFMAEGIYNDFILVKTIIKKLE